MECKQDVSRKLNYFCREALTKNQRGRCKKNNFHRRVKGKIKGKIKEDKEGF